MIIKEMQALIDKAIKAGMKAGLSTAPMSEDKESGFVWVIIHNKDNDSEREAFIEYMLDEEIVEPDFIYGGVQYRVKEFENSYMRRIAFAKAFAVVLVQAGFTAMALSRDK